MTVFEFVFLKPSVHPDGLKRKKIPLEASQTASVTQSAWSYSESLGGATEGAVLQHLRPNSEHVTQTLRLDSA